MKLLRTRIVRLVWCLLALSACAAPPATPTPTVQALPTATAAPTALPSPQTPTPALPALTLWVAEEEPALAVVRALAAEFAATHGAPITVVARPPDGLRLSIATAALNGDPLPDLIWADSENLAGLIADGRIQSLGAGAFPADTLPALRTAASADGKLWGMPVAASGALLLYYNRALIAEAPATSDELITRARAATTAEVAGLVMGWTQSRWLLPWLYAFGGAPTTPDGLTITLDTPAMTATLNVLRELYRAAPADGAAYSRGRRLFTQNYAAMSIDGDWSLSAYRAVSATLELGVAPLPTVHATGRAAIATLGGTYLMLGRSLAGTPLARGLAFGAFLAEPAIQARLAAGLGRLPATKSALNARAGAWAADPALAAAAAHATEAPGLPPTVAVRCALDGIDLWLPSLFKGSLPPDKAPATMQQEAEACLARSG